MRGLLWISPSYPFEEAKYNGGCRRQGARVDSPWPLVARAAEGRGCVGDLGSVGGRACVLALLFPRRHYPAGMEYIIRFQNRLAGTGILTTAPYSPPSRLTTSALRLRGDNEAAAAASSSFLGSLLVYI